MGTDIHGRLQFRWGPDMAYRDGGPIDDERNYRVFAMLAGVRNGFGFAGVKTHEPLVPISEPRGVPADFEISGHLKMTAYKDNEEAEFEYWLGDHSFSWVTLSEIVAWDGWDKPLALTGVLTAEEFRRIEREGGEPQEWCGSVSGRDVVVVTPWQARACEPHTHVHYDWQEPFRSQARCFAAWVDYLKVKYGWMLERDPAAVRLVFGFDS